MMNRDDSKCLIIVGMHRSGTSYTASVLKQSGLDIGDKLLGPGIGNELGHFENEDFYDFHRNVLTNRNYYSDGWSLASIKDLDAEEQLAAEKIVKLNKSAQWGWKDPRTVLFLDLWQKMLPNAYFLFIYRKPWEVVDSLFRRNRGGELFEQPMLAVKNWKFYNEQILNFFECNQERSLLLDIENIINNSHGMVQLINSRFGFKLKNEFIDTFDSKRFKKDANDIPQFFCESFFPDCILTYKKLRDNSSIKPLREYIPSKNNIDGLIKWWYDSTQLSRLNKEFTDYSNKTASIFQSNKELERANQDLKLTNESLKHTNHDLEYANKALSVENNYLQEEVSWIKSSKWWRLRKWFKK